MRPSKGNMYSWVTHTWNPVKGRCIHDCEYCYMKRFPQNPIRLDEKELRLDLGTGNTIFVGSSTDMFANNVSDFWIRTVLEMCRRFPNKYVFQTKNPRRFSEFIGLFPEQSVYGTTIETNRENNLSAAPSRLERSDYIQMMPRRFISIEPVMDFDIEPFVEMIEKILPVFVSIGADSKGHHLPEPDRVKVLSFINELEKFTTVKVKPNLRRLY